MTHIEMFRKILDDSGQDHNVEYNFEADSTLTLLRMKVGADPMHTIEASFNKAGEFIMFDVWEDES